MARSHCTTSLSRARSAATCLVTRSRHRAQLHQWQLKLFLERGAEAQQYLLSNSQRHLCCDAMQAQGTQVTISRLQRSVAAALASIQPGLEEEYLEPRTGYSLDLALPSSRIAIEVDGPSHFLLPDSQGVRTQRPNEAQAAPPRRGWLEGDQRSILRVGRLRDSQWAASLPGEGDRPAVGLVLCTLTVLNRGGSRGVPLSSWTSTCL